MTTPRSKEIWHPYATDKSLEGTIYDLTLGFDFKDRDLVINAILRPINGGDHSNFMIKYDHTQLISFLYSSSDRFCHVTCGGNPKGGIFIVENSAFLDFESTDWIGQYPSAKHFTFPTEDITLEVLSHVEPQIIV